jgi:hypothetical protein
MMEIKKYFASPSFGDDIELPPMEEATEETPSDDTEITLPDFTEEDVVKDENESDAPVTVEDTEKPKSDETKEDKKEPDEIDELSGEGIDLKEMFKDLDVLLEEQEEVIDKAEAGQTLSAQDIRTLQKTNEELIRKIDELESARMNLLYENAELKTFGNDSTPPELLVLAKHMDKMASDEKSKQKVLNTIKKMYEDITGEDIEQKDVDKKADILSVAEQYNSHSNPELKKQKDEEFTFVMD